MKKTLIDINDKFNTICIKYTFISKISRKNITSLSLLSRILLEANAKYKSYEELEKALEEMYGASISIDTYRFDSYNMAFEFMMEFIDPKLILDDNYSFKKALDFLKTLIYAPLIINNKFLPKIVSDAKESLYAKLCEDKSRPSSIVLKKICDLIFINEIHKINDYGYISDIRKISNKDLYNEYKSIINSDLIISVCGNLCKEELNYLDIYNDEIHYNFYNYEINKNYKKFIFKKNISSSYLMIAYKIDAYLYNKNYFNALVLNSILGKETNSLLFQKVRENLGLCYQISSRYYSNSGILLISASFDKLNYKKIIKEIDKVIIDIIKGNFDDGLVDLAKESILDTFKASLDSNDQEIYKLLMNDIYNIKYSNEYFTHELNKVEKKDVSNLLNESRKLALVYLKGEDKVE